MTSYKYDVLKCHPCVILLALGGSPGRVAKIRRHDKFNESLFHLSAGLGTSAIQSIVTTRRSSGDSGCRTPFSSISWRGCATQDSLLPMRVWIAATNQRILLISRFWLVFGSWGVQVALTACTKRAVSTKRPFESEFDNIISIFHPR